MIAKRIKLIRSCWRLHINQWWYLGFNIIRVLRGCAIKASLYQWRCEGFSIIRVVCGCIIKASLYQCRYKGLSIIRVLVVLYRFHPTSVNIFTKFHRIDNMAKELWKYRNLKGHFQRFFSFIVSVLISYSIYAFLSCITFIVTKPSLNAAE